MLTQITRFASSPFTGLFVSESPGHPLPLHGDGTGIVVKIARSSCEYISHAYLHAADQDIVM